LKHKIWLIFFVFFFIVLSASYRLIQESFLYKHKATIQPDEQEVVEQDHNWNQEKADPPSYDMVSLYDSSVVPPLDKLMINATFVNLVSDYQVPYFLGYSENGRYAAFILYGERDSQTYVINIYDTFVGEKVYSMLIPVSDHIKESKKLALAKEVLETGFQITIPPNKGLWKNQMKYKTEQGVWSFYQEKVEQDRFLKITKEDTEDEWVFLLHEEANKKRYIQLFHFPERPEWITLVPHVIDIEQEAFFHPVFLHLDHLNTENSIIGKREEADKWLYGNFSCIYDQGNTFSRKGYLAVSTDETQEEPKVPETIDQWIYLDPSGKMKWYGNSEGIFNVEGKPIQSVEAAFSYRIQLVVKEETRSLHYFIVDQLDRNTNQLIRTLEFQWDEDLQEMVPIQKVQIVSEEETHVLSR